jgi:hypothetical protein
MLRRLLPLVFAALLVPGIAWAEPLPLPMHVAAAHPRLTGAPDGGTVLSWVEDEGRRGLALRYSKLGPDGGWTKPVTVQRGSGWSVSWADAPTVMKTQHGWFALWTEPVKKDGLGTALMVSTSLDGMKWSNARRVHNDATDTEHGFASLLPGPDGVDVAWLDGRAYADGGGTTSLRMRRLGRDLGPERVLDERVCDCCPTAATPDGRALVWRDRIGGEIRDIAMATRGGGMAGSRATFDNWEFAGCPVNGPAIAHNGRDLLVWYTGSDEPTVQAVSVGEGWPRTPIEIDSGTGVLGRVGVAPFGHGWLVTWVRAVVEGRAHVMARTVSPEGELGEPRILGLASADRTAGVPTVGVSGADVLVIWQDGDPAWLSGVRLPAP